MTKKQGIRAVLFLVLLIGLLWRLDAVYRFEPNTANRGITRRFNELYTAQKDTWDGVLIGTSNVDRAWAAPLAWENYGMAVYPMSTDGGPFVLSSSIIEEVLKYQKVSFAVVDLHGVASDNMLTNSVKVRRVTDNMKRSGNWYQTIEKAVNYMEEYSPEAMQSSAAMLKASYIVPFIQFHTRLVSDGISIEDVRYLGTAAMKGTYKANQHKMTHLVDVRADETTPELLDLQKELLDDVIACAEKNNVQLLFMKVPTGLKPEIEESMNAAAAYVEQQGYSVLNFNDEKVLEESGMNGNEDFFDMQHLNTKGAAKFTEYTAAWLKTQVTVLADHRGDARYADWDTAAEEYDAFYQKSKKQIRKWLKKNPLTQANNDVEDEEDDEDEI